MNDKVKLKFGKFLPFESHNPIAILASGPSLLKTYNENLRSKYSSVIGINVAVDHFICDWWVFMDPLTFKRATPRGTPKFFIAKKVLFDEICREKIKDFTIIENVAPKKSPTFTFSIEAALILANSLNSNDLTFYGVDRSGLDDCNGDRSGWRDDKRWFSEKSRWSFWKKWFEDEQSVKVKFQYVKA